MRSRRSLPPVAALFVVTALAACTDQAPAPAPAEITAPPSRPSASTTPLPQLVRELAATRGIVPLQQPPRVRPALVRLGQALAFDRILSGNKDIACTTCHLPAFATGDGRSLSVGEGAAGLGPARVHPNGTFIPRNAPPLFNLGAMRHLFWDGRVQLDAQGKVLTPAGAQVTPAMQRVF
jgi:cytochrome c peroxidase